jgi:hypothetical protein
VDDKVLISFKWIDPASPYIAVLDPEIPSVASELEPLDFGPEVEVWRPISITGPHHDGLRLVSDRPEGSDELEAHGMQANKAVDKASPLLEIIDAESPIPVFCLESLDGGHANGDGPAS